MSNFCSYCGSLIINERCDSCGAPVTNTCKHISINDLRQSIENQKIKEDKSSAYTLYINRGGIRL